MILTKCVILNIRKNEVGSQEWKNNDVVELQPEETYQDLGI